MVLPSPNATATEIDNSVEIQQQEDRSLPINQVSLIGEGVINLPSELPVEGNHFVSLPTVSQNVSYDSYLDIRPSTFPATTPVLEIPSATEVRFKRPNCVTWNYPVDKEEVKIRMAIQDGQLFFDLNDILDGVCGYNVIPSKIQSLTKSLLPV